MKCFRLKSWRVLHVCNGVNNAAAQLMNRGQSMPLKFRPCKWQKKNDPHTIVYDFENLCVHSIFPTNISVKVKYRWHAPSLYSSLFPCVRKPWGKTNIDRWCDECCVVLLRAADGGWWVFAFYAVGKAIRHSVDLIEFPVFICRSFRFVWSFKFIWNNPSIYVVATM